MASVNKVILVGHLGKDPETRFMPSGDAVANFSIATTEKWKDKDGEKQERTEWHRCSAFGKTAEVCGEYLKKGSLVFVEGKLQTRKYQKDGQDHYSTEIRIDRVQFLDSKKASKPAETGDDYAKESGRSSRPAADKPAAKQGAGAFEQMDDDIPF